MQLESLAAVVAVVTIAAAPAFADCSLSGDALAGKGIVGLCKACHEFDSAKPSRPSAPNIHDVFGRTAGSQADFAKYSEGMKGANAKGLVWNEANLDEFIADPATFLSKVTGKEAGHTMMFKLVDAEKRKQIVAYLKAIKGNAECN